MSVDAVRDIILRSILAADVPEEGRILLAVSGGADSVALLHATLAVVRAGSRRWDVGIGHVNHSLRGMAAEEDEEFVRALAQREAVPCWSMRVDTASHARDHHQSVEEAARELRYAALRDLMRTWGADALMTGHTQDDQAETVVLRLLRGSGLRGLGGMRDKSGTLIRPFLPVRRAQVIEYLQSEGQGYRVDASNFDTHHLRNRLRRDIMPTLDLVQPRLVPVLARTARLLQRDSDFVFEQAGAALLAMDVRSTDGCVEASLGVWRSLHPALRRAALILMIDRLLGPSAGITAEQIDDLADGLERSRERLRTPLPHGVSLALRAGRFALTSMPAPDPPPLPDLILPVPGAVETEVGVLRAEIVEPAAAEHEHWMAVCGPLHALCDAEAVRGDLRLGGRRRGERIQPLGFSGSRKLQDLYVDRKIPRAERDRVPVIRDAVGIVWIPGIALDRRVALRPQTARVLHLRWRPGTGV